MVRLGTGLALGIAVWLLSACKIGTKTAVVQSEEVGSNAPCLEGGSWKKHICGPFSLEARNVCQDLGGSEPCLGDRWDRAFHRIVASRLSKPETHCVDTEAEAAASRCGPFPDSLVEACLAAKGGNACVGNRWSKKFYEALTRNRGTAGSEYGGVMTQAGAKVLEGVPFLSQPSSTTCGPTSMAMALRYKGVAADIWDLNSRIPAGVQSPANNAAEFRRRGLYADATNTGSKALIRRMIDEGRPVVLHTYLTYSGHVVLVIGYDKTKGGFWIHDPWGRYQGYRGSYGSDGAGGRMSFISWSDPNLMTADGDIWMSAGDTRPFSF